MVPAIRGFLRCPHIPIRRRGVPRAAPESTLRGRFRGDRPRDSGSGPGEPPRIIPRVTAADESPTRSPDWPLLAPALILGAAPLALVADPDLRFLVVAPGLDLVITTVATLAATGVS